MRHVSSPPAPELPSCVLSLRAVAASAVTPRAVIVRRPATMATDAQCPRAHHWAPAPLLVPWPVRFLRRLKSSYTPQRSMTDQQTMIPFPTRRFRKTQIPKIQNYRNRHLIPPPHKLGHDVWVCVWGLRRAWGWGGNAFFWHLVKAI